MIEHISPAALALHAGGDLPAWASLRIRVHLRFCSRCAAEARALAAARRSVIQEAAKLPASLDWDLLAGEIKANIRLGLAAGALVGPAGAAEPTRPPEPVLWRLGVVMASLSFVLAAGWWLNVPHPQPLLDPSAEVVLDAGQDGLAMRQQGAALTLLTPAGQPATTSISWAGAARVRYIDAETGQVTIHHVSAE